MTLTPRHRSRSARRLGAALAITAVVAVAGCSDADPGNTPPPGGTQTVTNASDVRAPNGTNMGATPPNVGTPGP